MKRTKRNNRRAHMFKAYLIDSRQSLSLERLAGRVKEGTAGVSIVGLGRVGLPLAVVLAKTGLHVSGFDVRNDVITAIREGRTPFRYPEIQQWLGEVVSNKSLTATSSYAEAAKTSDVTVITVGTPVGEQHGVDYTQIMSALDSVAKTDLKGKAVLMRSTTVPGTLAGLVAPMLAEGTGLKPDVDFGLAACPERILEGRAHVELYSLPELVGGIGVHSAEVASALFKRINPSKEILFTTPTGAELAKLFTNIYRYVNFALANEFALWAERYGEDSSSIIRLANSGYQRSKIPNPGFAGGPCLGKDGFLLENNTPFSSIITSAWKLNESIPQHVVNSLVSELKTIYARRITVLGYAFKAESGDARLSPAAKMVELLRAQGATVTVCDPHVEGTAPLSRALEDAEVVILAVNHNAFKEIEHLIDKPNCKIVYDVWNFLDRERFRYSKYIGFGNAR